MTLSPICSAFFLSSSFQVIRKESNYLFINCSVQVSPVIVIIIIFILKLNFAFTQVLLSDIKNGLMS